MVRLFLKKHELTQDKNKVSLKPTSRKKLLKDNTHYLSEHKETPKQ